MKHAVKLRFCFFLALLLIGTSDKLSAQQQKQLWFRPVQQKNSESNEQVIRVYYDKYGNYYPNLKLPLDSSRFFYPEYSHQNAEDTTSGNLYYYYKKLPQQMTALKKFYRVNSNIVFDRDFTKVQEAIVSNINDQVHTLVKKGNAKTIVFIIHGFNDPNATIEYRKLREVVKLNGYEESAKPVYIEIFWDGLTANGGNPATAGIWAHAQDNTRWICLAVRNLMMKLTDRLPMVVITHSLGASVGTGALFNTVSKWRSYKDKKIDTELHELLKAPTPMDVRIRLAMLAPAIPGSSTFCDFNNRNFDGPNIKPSQNKIDRIIIGYNPFDYATTKAFFKHYAFLAGLFGATTLGCDYGYPNNGKDEITRVKSTFRTLGYGSQLDKLLFPIRFTTEPANHGTQQHSMVFYLKDDPSIKAWLKDIFD